MKTAEQTIADLYDVHIREDEQADGDDGLVLLITFTRKPANDPGPDDGVPVLTDAVDEAETPRAGPSGPYNLRFGEAVEIPLDICR
jgi:hypothetical protein